jgi:hypothetical protein
MICKQDIRVNELLKTGEANNMFMEVLRLNVIDVEVQDADAPLVAGVTLGVPVPFIVMPIPLGIVIPPLQVHAPDGITIVSPSTAVWIGPLTILFTSVRLHVAAVNIPGGLMVREKAIGALLPAVLVAVTLKVDVPAAVGVPLKTPREERTRPVGRVVEVQVIGKVPVAMKVNE